MKLQTSGKVFIDYKGVPYNQIKDTKLKTRGDSTEIFEYFFLEKPENLLPKQFIRSSIIKLTNSNGSNTTFLNPILMTFMFNQLESEFKKMKETRDVYCLGKLNKNQWECVEKTILMDGVN